MATLGTEAAMDKLEFPAHLVDRMMQRRGRLHTFETLNPKSTALLVVDLQVHFMAEGSTAEMPSARDVVPNVNRLSKALRERGGQVVWVVSTYGPDEDDRWPNLFDHVLGPQAAKDFREGLTAGVPGHAIWPELDFRDGDPVVDKNRFGGFIGSKGRLEQVLRGIGVDTLLVVGTVTNVCCESTAREAASYNFKTIMIADANGGRSDQEDMETYSVFIAAYGDVMMTDDAIALLGPA
jgi:ureidoacrylate peracid hydrolase